MAHIPYGYRIVDGKAEIDEKRAETVRMLFDGYISGLSLKTAAENAGLNIFHGSVGKMLRNKHYLGDDYYPQIIDKVLFDKAEQVRIERAQKLGRIKELKPSSKPLADTKFSLGTVSIKFDDPFKQAEYAYSLIESEG